MQPTQADNELKEEHLLNFVVNGLDDVIRDQGHVRVDVVYVDVFSEGPVFHVGELPPAKRLVRL